MISDTQIRRILGGSLDDFFEAESKQILDGISERNLCGRLGVYMQEHARSARLSNYFADTEYNRMQGGQIKTIINGDLQVLSIHCDLILHSRGAVIKDDNLIAIEMKKAERLDLEKLDDRNRLIALTKQSFDDVWSADGNTHPEHVCGYRLGLYLELDRSKRFALLEYYERGQKCGSAKRPF